MRNGSTDLGTYIADHGGLDGGGWVTGLEIANDGTMVCRTDCAGIAGVRAPSDTRWRQLFRWGDNIPMSEYSTKALTNNNSTSWVYEAAIAPSNSQIIYASFLGFLWKTTNQTGSWTKLTGHNASFDNSFTFMPDAGARVGGRYIAIDPNNVNEVIVGHPVNALKYTLDGGTTWQTNASLPAPINGTNERRGVSIAYDPTSAVASGRTQTVFVAIAGRGTYKSTTGITGTFTLLSGGPLTCTSISAAGGRVAVCGRDSGVSVLYVHNGTSWINLGVDAFGCAFRPGSPSTLIGMGLGGDQFLSTNAGDTISTTEYANIAFKNDGAECPYLAVVNNDSMSLGAIRWHPTLNRIYVGNGIGVFYFDNPPRTSITQLYVDRTKGIQQKLVQDARVTPTGRLLVVAQDKPCYIYNRADVLSQPAVNHPDNLVPIRHGNGIDFAADDENYIVLTYQPAQDMTQPGTRTIMISTNGGTSWAPPASVPTFADSVTLCRGGNVGVGNVGNIVWVSTTGGPVKYTTNGGTNWASSTFRATAGGSAIDVSKARWHKDFLARRQILWADKATPGRFLIFVGSILDGTEQPASYAGIYESTDGGANFVRVADGAVFGFGSDEFDFKMRPVGGTYANHIFFARGNLGFYTEAPTTGGLKFSSNKGATKVDLPNWAEVEDIAFGKPKAGNSYPRLLVKGFYSGVSGYWYSDNFDPANPTAATFTLWTVAPVGRADDACMLAGDRNMLGRFYAVTSAGGFQVLSRNYNLRAS